MSGLDALLVLAIAAGAAFVIALVALRSPRGDHGRLAPGRRQRYAHKLGQFLPGRQGGPSAASRLLGIG